ncbi:aldehyde oxidase GLOX1-like [Euphorbia lathyris]|uniref:aldehyde oxidase GLOX1-like n=1 Tax=Euphorbia lathyris TaxID=212925 RepID=UPI003313234B
MDTKSLSLLLLAIFTSLIVSEIEAQSYSGKWKLLKKSIGISAMHMQLLPNDKIIIFDRTNFGPSNLSLPQGKCIAITQNTNIDCFAHSVEFDPLNRNVRPLTILTDTWCSSGALSSDGVLVQSGGYRLGERVVRTFKPCESCDWEEDPTGLIVPRWYASNQVLPNGKIIIVGGRYEFNYEFVPKVSHSDQTLFQLPFLRETRYSPLIPNNLYPFLHLSPDGNLFVFANDRAILLDYVNHRVVRSYPVMPGGISRNYPSTGSSVLLPIVLQNNNVSARTIPDAEVLICGGTLPDSNQKADKGVYVSASKSCGRIVITSPSAKWEMEEMPLKRVMGDMIMLPTGDVLIINGAGKGTAGWNAAREPVLNPVLYRTNFPNTDSDSDRFEIMSPSPIPRLYHSTAHLLSDGRVIVGGSNPNSNYNFTAIYPTELSLEAFSPPYLSSDTPRPTITEIKPGLDLSYRQIFSVGFELNADERKLGNIYVTMLAPSFTTHSFAMNQRLLVLGMENNVNDIEEIGAGKYVVGVNAPATAALAPAGYYQLFVVHEGVPSRAKWVHLSK